MKRILLGIVVLVLVVVGIGFFYFDSIVRTGIETAGSSVLGTEVTVGSAGVSPLSGSGGISELRIGNPEGFNAPYAMELGALDVQVNVGSVFSDVIEIESVIIQSPEITYETRITSDNIRTLLENIGSGGEQGSAPEESTESAKRVIIRDFQMIDPQVNLVAAVARAPVPLPDIHLTNIGEESSSVTVAEAGRQILAAINQALLGASLPSFEELQSRVQEELGDRVEELEDQVQDQVEDLTDRVRDIFN